MGHVVGIDLGTTYSCIASLEDGSPRVIPNLEGLSTTPSVVSFTSTGERLIGNLALRQSVTNPENTIYAVKRLIGNKFASREITEARERMAYALAPAPNGDALIVVNEEMITPQEISAMILSYLKSCAESYFGEEVREAVITVPAHFNDRQRQGTVDAAKIAGLDVLRVINEPTAASLAYGLTNREDTTAAVFDMGGGTFDITLLEIHDGIFHVLATNGNSYLGGEDFDNRIVDWIIEEFRKENKVDLTQDKFALQRVKEASERAKRELSFTYESDINLPYIFSGEKGSKHVHVKLTRRRLEELTEDLVRMTMPLVEQALADARLTPEKVQEVILVGGQTRMPLIRKTISEFFKKKSREDINPDEIVAMGAAIQSGILKNKFEELILLLDVTSLSLGIETENDTFQKIIDRNTTIPVKRAMPFTTVEHNQVRVRIHVLQGESEKASDNTSLAMFDLVGIEPAPAGVPQIDVTFEIDADGIVKVTAKDISTGREQKVEVKPSSGLTKKELQDIIQKSKAGSPQT